MTATHTPGGEQPWFERWPELLEWELGRFDAHGLPTSIDNGVRKAGRLEITTTAVFKGSELEVVICYPAEYPELPPTIFGPPGLLGRHQHRFGGNFCLLPRPLDDWPAREWGAADLVADRLSSLLRDSEAGPDRVRKTEAPMPEPFSSYFDYAIDMAVLLPEEAMPQADLESGSIRLRHATPHLLLVESSESGSARPALLSLFPELGTPRARFRRLAAPPDAGPDGVSILGWVRANHPNLLASRPPPPPPAKRRRRQPRLPKVEVCGLAFPEEGPGVGEVREAWMFLLVDRSEGPERALLLHGEVVSKEERGRRLSEVGDLSGSRVLVVGLGTVGAPIAIELARVGVGHLDLIDCERFEFGNTTRHPLGIEYIGLPKTRAVATACRRANPFCEVGAEFMRLGEVRWEGPSTMTRLVGQLENADLVVDATGSHQLAQLLARAAADAGVPMISAWMTDGLWGGEVVRIDSQTMCWTCFATAHREGDLLRAEAGPPSEVVVQGCSHPTTIGTGFDAAEIASAATRMALQTLPSHGTYPDSPFDHAALSFRRASDDPELPRFAGESLPPRQGCEQCPTPVGAPTAR